VCFLMSIQNVLWQKRDSAQHAETIHGVLPNPAVVDTEWLKTKQEIRIHNCKACPSCFSTCSKRKKWKL
jgi:hypothetical protein